MSEKCRFCCKSQLREVSKRDSVLLTRMRRTRSMMGRLKNDQGQLFYEFDLSDAVPEDHLVRKIDAALDLSWLRSELAPHYSTMGRPSIDPELMNLYRLIILGAQHNTPIVFSSATGRATFPFKPRLISCRPSISTLGRRSAWTCQRCSNSAPTR